MSYGRLILTVPEVADYASMHKDTVRRACESGELHGMQRKKGASWRVRRECVDAYLAGVQCGHRDAAA